MARFLTQADYESQIKAEVVKLLTATDWFSSAKLVTSENKAIAQIRQRIGKRYNCDTIFGATGEDRDMWIVTIVIDIALYHLYSQTGNKDVPQHRGDRYADAIDWLKDVGNGDTPAELPEVIDEDTGEAYSDILFSSRTPENHKW